MLKKPDEMKHLTKLGFEFSLFIGFIILNIYFFNIQFFPIVDLHSFAYLAIVVACLGILIFIIMILPLSVGISLWRELLKKKEICKLIFKEESDAFINSGNEGFTNLTSKTQLRLLFYYLVSIIIISLLLLAIFKHQPQLITYCVLGSMFFFSFQLNDNNKEKPPGNNVPKKCGKITNFFLILKLILLSIFPGIFLFIPSIILIQYSFIKENDADFFILFLIFLSGISLIPLKNWKSIS